MGWFSRPRPPAMPDVSVLAEGFDAVRRPLATAYAGVQEVLGKRLHLRANVMIPSDGDTGLELSMIAVCNMRDDAELGLRFAQGSGACGIAWDRLEWVVCDLDDAKLSYRTLWNMSPEQQRLVRTRLRSLVAVPLFYPHTETIAPEPLRRAAFQGVVSFDSDDRIVQNFFDPRVIDVVDTKVKAIARTVAETHAASGSSRHSPRAVGEFSTQDEWEPADFGAGTDSPDSTGNGNG